VREMYGTGDEGKKKVYKRSRREKKAEAGRRGWFAVGTNKREGDIKKNLQQLRRAIINSQGQGTKRGSFTLHPISPRKATVGSGR